MANIFSKLVCIHRKSKRSIIDPCGTSDNNLEIAKFVVFVVNNYFNRLTDSAHKPQNFKIYLIVACIMSILCLESCTKEYIT